MYKIANIVFNKNYIVKKNSKKNYSGDIFVNLCVKNIQRMSRTRFYFILDQCKLGTIFRASWHTPATPATLVRDAGESQVTRLPLQQRHQDSKLSYSNRKVII